MSDLRRPVVGLTGYFLDPDEADRRRFGRREVRSFALNYVRRTLAAGLQPILLPALGGDEARTQCDLIDGLILTGGEDIDPGRYGRAPEPGLRAVVPERDEHELSLFRAAAEHGLPVLAICRGLQLVNVALGGTLVQDLRPADGEPDHEAGVAGHEVFVSDVGLAAMIGERCVVNSFHHQAVDELAPGLEGAARAGGVIEAAVGSDPPLLAVQWHPERLAEDDPAGAEPFAWLARMVTRTRPRPTTGRRRPA